MRHAYRSNTAAGELSATIRTPSSAPFAGVASAAVVWPPSNALLNQERIDDGEKPLTTAGFPGQYRPNHDGSRRETLPNWRG
ncbi:hypothetical protein [Amycolatopsis sp. NPDC051716]|jgi:hypothetical protein|uniref:hypothetical protein n=1 Tax=Amycolatopsis sp. NPDC051716 TaxID=3155804 RepID=UPI0034166AEE